MRARPLEVTTRLYERETVIPMSDGDAVDHDAPTTNPHEAGKTAGLSRGTWTSRLSANDGATHTASITLK
jgi:hypothetical protein